MLWYILKQLFREGLAGLSLMIIVFCVIYTGKDFYSCIGHVDQCVQQVHKLKGEEK